MATRSANVLTLALRPATRELDIRVDGRDLIDLAREVERPHAVAAGTPDIAGAYGPLERGCLSNFAGEFLGRGRIRGETVLVDCSCGVFGCWPLWARIEVGERSVLWTGFRQPCRPEWDLSTLSFEFERAAYESEIERIARDLRRPSDVSR